LHQFGCNTISLSNRTRATAEEIAQSFASLFKIIVIGSLEEFSNDGRIAPDILVVPDILIGTIPADKTTLNSFPQSLFAKPEGVCVDMSHNPRYTPLLAATEYGEGRLENRYRDRRSAATGLHPVLDVHWKRHQEKLCGRQSEKQMQRRKLLRSSCSRRIIRNTVKRD